MKLLVIGLGGCGGRLADEFARLGRRARRERGIEIVTDSLALNTNVDDLSRLSTIKSDRYHRILLGREKALGHGVGRISEIAAEIARQEADQIIDVVTATPLFLRSEALLLIASADGGTGSGSIPVVSRVVKERHLHKPLYNLIVLPSGNEELTAVRAIYNSVLCLRNASTVADAILLVDNQRYLRGRLSLETGLKQINASIVEPFYDLLCAAEHTKRKSAETLGASDIVETLAGWTVVSHGQEQLSPAFSPQSIFRKRKGSQKDKWVTAVLGAIDALSLKCDPALSRRALYLLSGPVEDMSAHVVREIGKYLRDVMPGAAIRNGTYSSSKRSVGVTLVLSELREIQKIDKYYESAAKLLEKIGPRQAEIANKLKESRVEIHISEYPPFTSSVSTLRTLRLAKELRARIDELRQTADRYVVEADELDQKGEISKADSLYQKAFETQPSLSFEGVVPSKALHRGTKSKQELYSFLRGTASLK